MQAKTNVTHLRLMYCEVFMWTKYITFKVLIQILTMPPGIEIAIDNPGWVISIHLQVPLYAGHVLQFGRLYGIRTMHWILPLEWLLHHLEGLEDEWVNVRTASTPCGCKDTDCHEYILLTPVLLMGYKVTLEITYHLRH